MKSMSRVHFQLALDPHSTRRLGEPRERIPEHNGAIVIRAVCLAFGPSSPITFPLFSTPILVILATFQLKMCGTLSILLMPIFVLGNGS
jgi:hypothetical protein